MKSKIFRLWAKALGEKASHDNKEADAVASIRTLIFFSYLITNIFIAAGVVRHWDSDDKWNTDINSSPCVRSK